MGEPARKLTDPVHANSAETEDIRPLLEAIAKTAMGRLGRLPELARRARRVDPLVAELAEAVAELYAGQELLTRLVRYLCGNGRGPRDLRAERIALMLLLSSELPPEQLAEIDFDEQLVAQVRSGQRDADGVPAVLSNCIKFDGKVDRLLLRLEALTRQRRALQYVEAARRELSSRQCDHGVAEAHIRAAEQCLFSERCTSGSQ